MEEDSLQGMLADLHLFPRVIPQSTQNVLHINPRLHFIGVTPTILGVILKILWHTGVRLTRCWCTEASHQGVCRMHPGINQT